jgi:hypothetical protein
MNDAGGAGMDQAAAEAAMDAALAADAAAADAAAADGFTPSADLAGFSGFTPQDINIALGHDITPQSMMALMNVTPSTVTAPTLNVLMNAGYGNVEGLNPNNPTQSVAEMLAAQNVANNLPMAFNFMVPGLGTAMNVAKNAVESFGGLTSGSMTPGQALGNLGLSAFGFGNSSFNQGPAIGNMSTGQAATTIGLSALANQLGIPGGASMLGNILEGNFGPVAGGLAAGLANQAVGQATGLGPLAGLAMQATGISPAIGKAVAETVPSAPQGTGLLSAIANMFDQSPQGKSPGIESPQSSVDNSELNVINDLVREIASGNNENNVEQDIDLAPKWSFDTQPGRYGPVANYRYGA